jgi:hypothetical protein
VPIGKGAWVIDIGDDQFTAAASGMTSGLLRVFATGQGNAASRGAVRSDILAPTIFVSTINNEKRVEELRIVLSAGIVKELVVDPPTTPNPERVPLTDAHRRGVTDPMSAALIRVSGSGDPVSPEACRRTLPVFDGRMRFDLQLSFKRIEKVQAQKGYLSSADGGLRGAIRAPRGLCARTSGHQISHGPAGHGNMAGADPRNPDRSAISYLAPDPIGPGGPRGHTIRRSSKPSLHTRHRGGALSVFAVQHPPSPYPPSHAGEGREGVYGLDNMESVSAWVFACRRRLNSCRGTDSHHVVQNRVVPIPHPTTYG